MHGHATWVVVSLLSFMFYLLVLSCLSFYVLSVLGIVLERGKLMEIKESCVVLNR